MQSKGGVQRGSPPGMRPHASDIGTQLEAVDSLRVHSTEYDRRFWKEIGPVFHQEAQGGARDGDDEIDLHVRVLLPQDARQALFVLLAREPGEVDQFREELDGS